MSHEKQSVSEGPSCSSGEECNNDDRVGGASGERGGETNSMAICDTHSLANFHLDHKTIKNRSKTEVVDLPNQVCGWVCAQ
jgi:hypothetical protein